MAVSIAPPSLYSTETAAASPLLMHEIVISKLVHPAKQEDYRKYAEARYTPYGIGEAIKGGKYTAFESDVTTRWRVEEPREEGTDSRERVESSGPPVASPLPLIAIALSQGDEVRYYVHTPWVSSLQPALMRDLPAWKELSLLPWKGLDVMSGGTPAEALNRLEDGSLDEINIRYPNPSWKGPEMEELAETMIKKLNVGNTCHPIGASVLIGTSTDFLIVFRRKLAEHGDLEIIPDKGGVFKVAGKGADAELIFVSGKKV